MTGAATVTRVREVFDAVCNWGRWGPDDQRGTLNLVDLECRRRALATVRSGQMHSISRPIDPAAGDGSLTMTTPASVAATTCRDELSISPHGFTTTHVDALGHCFFDGRAWNGRHSADVVTSDGLTFADVSALADGIMTRGVLLDVARARGVDHLRHDETITPGDLDAAEALAGTRVTRGDAVVVRTGRAVDEARGSAPADARAGLDLECLLWLHDRQVGVYSGDCVDQLPSPVPGYPDYFHQIALAGMGLVLLDMPDVERLRDLVEAEGRPWFLLVLAPLAVRRATGVAVNPLVVF